MKLPSLFGHETLRNHTLASIKNDIVLEDF